MGDAALSSEVGRTQVGIVRRRCTVPVHMWGGAAGDHMCLGGRRVQPPRTRWEETALGPGRRLALSATWGRAVQYIVCVYCIMHCSAMHSDCYICLQTTKSLDCGCTFAAVLCLHIFEPRVFFAYNCLQDCNYIKNTPVYVRSSARCLRVKWPAWLPKRAPVPYYVTVHIFSQNASTLMLHCART